MKMKHISNVMGSQKVEPVARAVSPGAVSQIGNKIGNHASDGGGTIRVRHETMYEGKGYKSPGIGGGNMG
ncbi:MAG: hypothetical protein KGL39_54900, partial [Patescibacteria group bacterium]|nr:hypothetical protein [Patescibacteria group bacterium]